MNNDSELDRYIRDRNRRDMWLSSMWIIVVLSLVISLGAVIAYG